jgi:hypothetical protein
MSESDQPASESVAAPAVDPPAEQAPPRRKAGRPKGSKTRYTREAIAAAAEAERNTGPTMHDMMTAAARFHYAEAAKAQQILNNPASDGSEKAKALKDLERHLDKAATHAKPALPYELAKLGPQKAPVKTDDNAFDFSRLTDGDVETLGKIVAAATVPAVAQPPANNGRAPKTRH